METKNPVPQKAESFRRQRILAVLSAVFLLIGSLCFARWMLPERKPVLAELERPAFCPSATAALMAVPSPITA